MTVPWYETPALSRAAFEDVRLRTIFDCCKWDPQIGDVSILADFPLILQPDAWTTLAALAEQLAAETLAAEHELLQRPELHGKLGLPKAITRLWSRPPAKPDTRSHVRTIRFDFHYTTEGWRISEANTDTPGGYIEASGFTALMAQHYPPACMSADPARLAAQAIRAAVSEEALVALIHATAYSDDRQIMVYLSKHLEAEGLRTTLINPGQLQWQTDGVQLATDWQQDPVDFLVRFFPAEWLADMPRASGWQHYFSDQRVPACNPTTAFLTQTKRFPVIWDELKTPLPTWRKLLPETLEPRQVKNAANGEWVYKPALGRVGEMIGIPGITDAKTLQDIQRHVKKHPDYWVVQRRFDPVPMVTPYGMGYPCIGVYTINGRAAGIYGRLGSQPFINMVAQDIAVLVEDSGGRA